MAKAYVLSESDLKEVKRLVTWWRGGGAGKSSRPVPTRRRQIAAGDGKAELIGAFAIIKGDVPASANIQTTGDLSGVAGQTVFEPGELPAVTFQNTFTEGALLVNPDGSVTRDDSGNIIVVDVLNPSYSRFQAGGEGILMPGNLVKVDEDSPASKFIIAWPDFRGGVGYAKGVPPTGLDDPDLQIWFHKGGNEEFELNSNDCATV